VKERVAVIAMEDEIDRNRLKVARALWRHKLGRPSRILARHVETYGLAFNEKETLRQIDRMTTPRMTAAVNAVMRLRHERELRRRRDAYDASVQAVRELITAHRRLEAGEAPSWAALRAFLKTVDDYTQLVREVLRTRAPREESLPE
jgi:hypothetical protein